MSPQASFSRPRASQQPVASATKCPRLRSLPMESILAPNSLRLPSIPKINSPSPKLILLFCCRRCNCRGDTGGDSQQKPNLWTSLGLGCLFHPLPLSVAARGHGHKSFRSPFPELARVGIRADDGVLEFVALPFPLCGCKPCARGYDRRRAVSSRGARRFLPLPDGRSKNPDALSLSKGR